MKTIKGKYHYQVKDLIEDLKQYPEEAILFGTYHDQNKKDCERSIYKTVETAKGDKVFLYLGDDKG